MNATLFGQQWAVREPRVLWVALVLVMALAAFWWRARGRVPWPALLLRSLATLAFTVALAQPLLARPAPASATILVVDRSRSIGGERLADLETQLTETIAANAGREPLGLVAFAERATVVYPAGGVPLDPGQFWPALNAADVGSTDYSNLTAALRLAEALPVSAGGGKRIVLLSDGQETLGRALEWAGGARGRGVVVDVLAPNGRPWGSDARIADLTVPESTWQGGDIEIGAVVSSDVAGSATVTLTVDGRAAGQQAVTLRRGANNLDFRLTPLPPGYHAMRVEVTPAFADALPENNVLATTTVVRGKPRVLVLEARTAGGDRLARALERASSEVTVRSPATLTDRLADLASFDAIVLVDVPIGALSAERQQVLQEYARALGRGLVVTGGPNSFGKGGYERTALEEALPVRVKPRDEGKRAPAALLLIIDRSYSMTLPPSGPSRIEMAKAAAAGAVRTLSPGDEVAVLAFGDTNFWVTPLRTINSSKDIDEVVGQIGKLAAEGETQMYRALVAGIDELKKSSAGTKHIVLLSDGAPSQRFDVNELTGRVRAGNMTLSAIAIGEGADQVLMQDLAKGGNGRYSFARRADEIPRLTLEEAEQLGGKLVASGNFRAVQTAPSPILRGLDPTTLPTLDGYDITQAKPDAQVTLASGRNEPVLAQWQYGLGRVVTWTSDLGDEMAPNWKDASAFGQFWNQAVRWTLPAASSRSFQVRTTLDGRDLVVTVDAFDDDGARVNLAETRATLRTPGGEVRLALPQTGPGRYEVRLSGPVAGAYQLELRQNQNGRTVADVAGFRVPYPAELRATERNGALLEALANLTGGAVAGDPAALFARRVETRLPRYEPVWPWFAALGLGLFLLDIAWRLSASWTPTDRLRRLLPR